MSESTELTRALSQDDVAKAENFKEKANERFKSKFSLILIIMKILLIINNFDLIDIGL